MALSDGIFAIAMTLLVMELKTPDRAVVTNEAQLLDALLAETPKAIAFVTSFFTIGIYWITHHRYLRSLQSYDLGLLWWNLVFLFCVAFHPFPSGVAGVFGDMRPAWIFYALSLALMGIVLRLMWRHTLRRGLLHPGVDPPYLRYVGQRSLAATGCFTLSAVLAVWSTTAAQFAMLLIPASMWAINRSHARTVGGAHGASRT